MNATATGAPILLVEDNPMDVDLTLRAFKRKNLDNPIHVARDGEEALAFIGRWESGLPLPAVILLDINLPKISGLDVLRQLKAHEKYRHIPVVMLTSSKDDRDLKAAYDLCVNSYIEKPVNFNKFMEVAEQVESYWCTFNERTY